MSTVHPSAAIGFDRAAADYERGRPGYPPAAIELVARELGLGPDSRVVDLAAGTGKLTRALVPLGAQLIAVEPVAGMREQLQRTVPGVTTLEGTAEAIPLPDHAVDAVLVAQAFHWFDTEAAAAEIARVLIPGGGLAIIRNNWGERLPWLDELWPLIEGRRDQHPASGAHHWRARLERTGRFATPLREAAVDHVVRSDRETLLARISSLSYVAMLDSDERRQLLDRVGALLDRHGVGGPGEVLDIPHRTHIVWTRALPG